MTVIITEEWLTGKHACGCGVMWFQAQPETDAVRVLEKLIAADKLSWASWLIVRVMDYKQCVSYGVYAAEQVMDIFEREHPTDNRPRLAIEAARKCIVNPSTENKWAAYAAAANVARAAAYADSADYAANVARAAAYAASAADAAAAAYAADAAGFAADADGTWTKMKLKILQYGLTLLEEK